MKNETTLDVKMAEWHHADRTCEWNSSVLGCCTSTVHGCLLFMFVCLGNGCAIKSEFGEIS